MVNIFNFCIRIHVLWHLVFITVFISSSAAFSDDGALLNKIKDFKQSVRSYIYPNNSYVHKFIQDDLFAAQWLNFSSFDINLARHNFMEHLAWRNAEKIDTIHLENWGDFPSDYPQFLNTANSRPVAECWLAQWDVRRAVFTGQRPRLIRWMVHLLEMTQRNLFEVREKGHLNITSGIEIIDMGGFHLKQHGCFACVAVYNQLSQLWEKHYPKLWENVYMLNVGPSFRTFLDMGKVFNYGRDRILKLFNSRAEWIHVLDREISKNQRSIRFGGHIDRTFIN